MDTYRFINEDLEHITDKDFLGLLYYQFGHGQEPGSGYTDYEVARMNIMIELTTILRNVLDKSPLLKRALYLAELEDKCLGLDMVEPLEPKLSKAC